MAKDSSEKTRALARYKRQHKNRLKRFPLPNSNGDCHLTYKNISILLKGGHQNIFDALTSEGVAEIPSGWQCSPIWIGDLQNYCEYKNESTTRAATEKLKKKLKQFGKVGLVVSIQGNYRSAFSIRFIHRK